MSASLSTCGRYRYRLTRVWSPSEPLLPFIMLNPSTADATVDDPTIRRCKGFAERERYGGIVVVNLYGLRATRPDVLWGTSDPIGPENDHAIARVTIDARGPIVCAWGVNGDVMNRGAKVLEFIEQIAAVDRLVCLGKTKSGAPRHPLYVPANQPLEPYP